MEAKISNLERTDNPDTIREIVLEVVKIMNVNQIYLTIGEKQHAFKYRMVIITEDMARIFKEQAWDRLNRLLKPYPQFFARFFTLHYVRDETDIGNTFFLCNCTKETLIYCNPHFGEEKLFKKVDFSMFVKNADCLFTKEMEKVESFKKGADLFLGDGNHNQAAFMLHQTFELGFLTAERFLMGVSAKKHSINDHQNFIAQTNIELGSLFPNGTDNQKKLLKKLDSAYVKSRYRFDYRIKGKQIGKLNKKAKKLISLLEVYIENEIMKCQKTIELFENDFTIKDNQLESASKENDKTNALSKQILIEPNSHYESDYLARQFEFDNPFEMLCMAKSLLAVCSTCLQDDVEPPMHVSGFDYSINEVLQLAIEFLPLKETSP